MKNIRVAVLDTGIANEIVDERIKYKIQIYYDYYTEKVMYNELAVDYNGHGTKCINTMWSKFPYMDIYVIKMLNISGITNSIVFKEALKTAQKLEVDIISICASYIVSDIDKDIEKLCNDIAKSGKVIVASVENGKTSSAIANYSSVIGVIGGMMNDHDFHYSKNKEIQMQCSAMPVILQGVRGVRDTFQGNSRATAIATAVLAEILFQNGGKIEEIIQNLQEKTSSHEFCSLTMDVPLDSMFSEPFNEEKELYYTENDAMYQRFIYLLCEFYMCENPNEIRRINLIMYDNMRLGRHLEDILRLIEERFKVSLGIIRLKDLQWPYLFYEKYIAYIGEKDGEE